MPGGFLMVVLFVGKIIKNPHKQGVLRVRQKVKLHYRLIFVRQMCVKF